MKLYLDDLRTPPFGYDLWAKTAAEAIELLEKAAGGITHVSLDHDLAEEHYDYAEANDPIPRSVFKEPTGYAVLEWMRDKGSWVPSIYVHTFNRMGGSEMMAFIKEHAPKEVCAKRTDPKAPPPEKT